MVIVTFLTNERRENIISKNNNTEQERRDLIADDQAFITKKHNDSLLFGMKTKYETIIADLSSKLNVRFDKIEKKIDNKEDYDKYLAETNNSSVEYLVKRYPYGYILFGIWDGNFVYRPSLKSTDLNITADWEKTKLEWNKLSNTMKLIIKNLLMKNDNINIHAGTSVTDNILIRPKGSESPVGGIYLGHNVNMYLEQLDNKYPDNPIFAIGFKK
jgi:hypothetical protein